MTRTDAEPATGAPLISHQEAAGQEITRALSVFKSPGDLIEIRTNNKHGWNSGYYHATEDAARAAQDAEKTAKGTFFIFNEIRPDLFPQDSPLGKRTRMTTNADMVHRRWLMIDIDPERQETGKGTNSTDEEKAESLRVLDSVIDFLTDMGYPAPVITDSGNGYHCYYRADLPNEKIITELVKNFLNALDAKFSTAAAKVDTGNSNAARLTKLPGTMTRKGPDTPDRPHRRSHLVEVPDQIKTVTREQIEAVAALHQPKKSTRPKKATASHRAAEARKQPQAAAKDGHKTTGTRREIIEAFNQKVAVTDMLDRYCKREGDRWLSPYSTGGDPGISLFEDDHNRFYSHHDSDPESVRDGHSHSAYDALVAYGHGGDEKKAFAEACEMVGMSLQQGTQSGPRNQPSPTPAHAAAEPEETEADPRDIAEAERVLTEGDPLTYFLEVFHTAHVGDDILAKCCYVSAASRMVENSRGLHVLAIGPSGKGKSSTYDTALEQMPDRFKVDGGLSDKALFYHPVPERAIFVLDDKEMSDALQEVFRGATSNIQKPYDHRTMINKKPVVLTLPAGCVWWMAASEDDADDQFHNRCLHPWVDDSKEADRAYCEHLLRSAAEGAREDPRFAICRCMWDLISSDVLPVWVWFAEAIQFDDVSNRRNPMIFLDLIHAITRMRYLQREKDPDRGIIASLDDFATARDIYAALNGDEGSQGTQLTPDEARLLEIMNKMGGKGILLEELVDQTPFAYNKVYRLIAGRTDRNTTGLLSKCPALTQEKGSSTVSVAEGITRGKQLLKFTLDRQGYIAWKSRGGVTLNPDHIEDVLSRLAHGLPTICPHMGKRVIGTYGASFPNLTNIIIHKNYNNNNFPKRRKREGDTPESIDTLPHTHPYSLTSGKWANVDQTPTSEQKDNPDLTTDHEMSFPINGGSWENGGKQFTAGGKP